MNVRLNHNYSSRSHQIGAFVISWNAEQTQLTIAHHSEPNRFLWASTPGESFVQFANCDLAVKESRGFFKFNERRRNSGSRYSLEEIFQEDSSLVIRGKTEGPINGDWLVTFTPIDTEQLQIKAKIDSRDNLNANHVTLVHTGYGKEKVFGFGEQFTNLNINGKKIRVLSQEPGIGRGVQPLTWFMETFFGAGGQWDSSNAPAPHYLTSSGHSFFLENSEYSIFDFTNSEQTKIQVYADTLCGRIIFGKDPFEQIEVYTRYAGRMPAPPQWLQTGAVIGMQGGTQAAQKMKERLLAHHTPIAAFWLQDWVGSRKTSVGKQLWWNWEIGRETYPNWEELVEEFKNDDIRVLGYINPFLVDPTEKGQFERNLFQEAIDNKYVITRPDGEPYWILNTSFSAVLLDLTNSDAREWIKDVIKKQLIKSGVSGWMADFGEALPFDAVLSDGTDAAKYHNQYPVEWVRINREAIQEAGKEREIAFFARSGFTQSPLYSTLFWMGDQLVGWSREDGIKSTVVALLSSGFSGYSQNHSDIGGYTATTVPSLPFKIPGLGYTRSRELLWRWIELNAFTPVYRTHEGNQPTRNYQIDRDDETMSHFARFARVFAALGDYRQQLSQEAADKGTPLIRHPWLHFPEDPETLELELQFMLGPDFMISPTLDSNQRETITYLPRGTWTHLWSNESIDLDKGKKTRVKTPIGYPSIFYRAESSWGQRLHEKLASSDDLKWSSGSAFISKN